MVDAQLSHLKQADNRTSSTTDNEVYLECLIRSNGNVEQAIEMLQNARPNLVS